MLDAILTDLEAHCERCTKRLEDIIDTRERLHTEEELVRAELKAGLTVFQSAKKTVDAAVRKATIRAA